MPTTYGDFINLKGNFGSFKRVEGVKVLKDADGRDLIKLIDNLLSEQSSGSKSGQMSPEVLSSLEILSKRVESIENFLGSLRLEKGEKGPKGDTGETGPQGEPGPQGPRGKGVTKLSELADVNLDGLDDDAILVWSGKDKKWVISLEEK
jgi:hypothetical protein